MEQEYAPQLLFFVCVFATTSLEQNYAYKQKVPYKYGTRIYIQENEIEEETK